MVSLSCCNLSLWPIPPVHFFVLEGGDQPALVSNLIGNVVREALVASVSSAAFCGNGSDTSQRRFSEPGYCVQSGAQMALNGNDSVCLQTNMGQRAANLITPMRKAM